LLVLGWNDPRGCENDEPLVVQDARGLPVPRDDVAARALEEREGWLMWPERFGPKEIGRPFEWRIDRLLWAWHARKFRASS
jgi:hypothetical protein